MRKGFVLVVFLLLSSVFLGQVRQWTDNNDLVYHINVLNTGTSDTKDLRVTVFIPDLGLFKRTNRFDLGNGDIVAKVLLDTVPAGSNTPHLTRITVSSSEKGILDTKYIYTIV